MDFGSDFLCRDMGLETDGDDEHTLAHRAAASGDTQSVIRAIKQDPGVIQQKDRDGYTPLAHAVLGKHVQTLKRLVKMGADVNVQDAQGRTCLAIAAYQGWSDGVVYLLRKGARQDIVDKSGRTPLHAATYDTDNRSLLALMKRLSEAEINIGDNERMTALHWAAFHNRPEHVKQLLQRGGLPTQVDIDGKTPLHWAAQNGSASCCPILTDHNIDLANTIDNCGKTALHLAAAAGYTAILQDLARISPSTCEAWDKDDRTPLHWAAATGHTSCVRALLNMGVTPNPVDVDGVTPLEYATNAGHRECIVLLRDRLGIKPSGNKRKQNDQKQSAGGFFKGLFSRKKDADNRKETVSKDTKLPQVFGVKNESMINKNNDTKGGLSASTSPRGVTTPREGGAKRLNNAKRDAGASTPATIKTLSTWTDNSSYLSGNTDARATHLSPLGGLRPPSISPRIANSPGVMESPRIRKQRELSPLRLDRMVKERFELPVPEPVSTLQMDQDRVPTSTPTTQIKFNINGKTVLPNIHAESAELDMDSKHGGLIDSDPGPSVKKKKHKKNRKERGQREPEVITATPLEHETNIYRPQDRGKEKNAPNLTADDTRDNGTLVDNTCNSANKDRQTEQEVIKALAGLEMNELSYLSRC
ncbi:ankyrin repeat domain-containing protein 55-like isoform X2 [Ruditapes philippinarum]|uniref:ankyrin repeat domain-containing protein 55-like isoform X2 n=1 Tax=Ruditapes philippinarum TaxID=129788 RepID=UPI00295C2F58|nr:ankyrin repeat domain-containing protein 55-like isoform X2 [Ruditapes philippinarum]